MSQVDEFIQQCKQKTSFDGKERKKKNSIPTISTVSYQTFCDAHPAASTSTQIDRAACTELDSTCCV